MLFPIQLRAPDEIYIRYYEGSERGVERGAVLADCSVTVNSCSLGPGLLSTADTAVQANLGGSTGKSEISSIHSYDKMFVLVSVGAKYPAVEKRFLPGSVVSQWSVLLPGRRGRLFVIPPRARQMEITRYLRVSLGITARRPAICQNKFQASFQFVLIAATFYTIIQPVYFLP